MRTQCYLTLFSTLLYASTSLAAEKLPFPRYVDSIKQEATSKGFSSALVDSAFADVAVIEKAISLDKSQPEFKLTLDSYLPKALPQWKIDKARKLYQQHYSLLSEIGQRYGVQPRFIVALWGIETNFGSYTGSFPLISALTTLAWDGRREAFFKEQLFAALTILAEGHIQSEEFKGSWAGAMGQVQFMPTSFLKYAADGNFDGKKDLWNSLPDVFASAANYLKTNGWNNQENWGRRVTLTKPIPKSQQGLEVAAHSVTEWNSFGVRNLDGSPLPHSTIPAHLVMPDDQQGRAYLAYPNYLILRHWNRSHYFVIAVGSLADLIVKPH